MQFKNFKNIDKVVFGRGSFNCLEEIIEPVRKNQNSYFVFLLDAFFKDSPLISRIPQQPSDLLFFVDVNGHEPTTNQVDKLRDEILIKKGMPAGVVGIGGGSVMDIAKAVSLMVTNEGSSELYQGLNLIKNPGIYHLGIPTVSGTGAECSSTAVLTGPKKKLGLKCEWTVFNQIILDPELIASVPSDWWFHAGMDTFIHCIESEQGILNNAFSHAYADQALALCRNVFLEGKPGRNSEKDEKLMVASLMGGLSLSYSEVGVCHALSYGLSKILDYRHCFANCVAFQHLADIYQAGVSEFDKMVEHNKVILPQNLSKGWSDSTIKQMAEVAFQLHHMWNQAYGTKWREKIDIDFIAGLYRRM